MGRNRDRRKGKEINALERGKMKVSEENEEKKEKGNERRVKKMRKE